MIAALLRRAVLRYETAVQASLGTCQSGCQQACEECIRRQIESLSPVGSIDQVPDQENAPVC